MMLMQRKNSFYQILRDSQTDRSLLTIEQINEFQHGYLANYYKKNDKFSEIQFRKFANFLKLTIDFLESNKDWPNFSNEIKKKTMKQIGENFGKDYLNYTASMLIDDIKNELKGKIKEVSNNNSNDDNTSITQLEQLSPKSHLTQTQYITVLKALHDEIDKYITLQISQGKLSTNSSSYSHYSENREAREILEISGKIKNVLAKDDVQSEDIKKLLNYFKDKLDGAWFRAQQSYGEIDTSKSNDDLIYKEIAAAIVLAPNDFAIRHEGFFKLLIPNLDCDMDIISCINYVEHDHDRLIIFTSNKSNQTLSVEQAHIELYDQALLSSIEHGDHIIKGKRPTNRNSVHKQLISKNIKLKDEIEKHLSARVDVDQITLEYNTISSLFGFIDKTNIQAVYEELIGVENFDNTIKIQEFDAKEVSKLSPEEWNRLRNCFLPLAKSESRHTSQFGGMYDSSLKGTQCIAEFQGAIARFLYEEVTGLPKEMMDKIENDFQVLIKEFNWNKNKSPKQITIGQNLNYTNNNNNILWNSNNNSTTDFVNTNLTNIPPEFSKEINAIIQDKLKPLINRCYGLDKEVVLKEVSKMADNLIELYNRADHDAHQKFDGLIKFLNSKKVNAYKSCVQSLYIHLMKQIIQYLPEESETYLKIEKILHPHFSDNKNLVDKINNNIVEIRQLIKNIHDNDVLGSNKKKLATWKKCAIELTIKTNKLLNEFRGTYHEDENTSLTLRTLDFIDKAAGELLTFGTELGIKCVYNKSIFDQHFNTDHAETLLRDDDTMKAMIESSKKTEPGPAKKAA